MSKETMSFICRGCLNLVTSAGRTNLNIDASARLELVDKFCYLGDMLSSNGDADDNSFNSFNCYALLLCAPKIDNFLIAVKLRILLIAANQLTPNVSQVVHLSRPNRN